MGEKRRGLRWDVLDLQAEGEREGEKNLNSDEAL